VIESINKRKSISSCVNNIIYKIGWLYLNRDMNRDIRDQTVVIECLSGESGMEDMNQIMTRWKQVIFYRLTSIRVEIHSELFILRITSNTTSSRTIRIRLRKWTRNQKYRIELEILNQIMLGNRVNNRMLIQIF